MTVVCARYAGELLPGGLCRYARYNPYFPLPLRFYV